MEGGELARDDQFPCGCETSDTFRTPRSCRGDPKTDRGCRFQKRRPPGLLPGHRGADPRPPLRLRCPPGQDHLGCGSPGLRPQAHHRATGPVPHAPKKRRCLRLPATRGEHLRRLQRGPQQHLDLGLGRDRRGALPQGRELQGRRRHRRRLHDGGHGLRRAQLGGRPQEGPHHHPQRQRDVDLAQRGRPFGSTSTRS